MNMDPYLNGLKWDAAELRKPQRVGRRPRQTAASADAGTTPKGPGAAARCGD